MKTTFGQILGVLAVLSTVVYIVHRVTRQRQAANQTIRILGPRDRNLCQSLLSLKPKKNIPCLTGIHQPGN